MKPLLNSLFLTLLIINISCDSIPSKKSMDIVILHINDVYEIAAVNGGKEGGYARLAYLIDSLREENPNLLVVHAGDFLSPSLIGNLKDDSGNKIKGRHMIEAMNASGVDVVTFGNHEFDIKEEELQNRIDESTFKWISANVYHNQQGKKEPFMQKNKCIPPTMTAYFVDGNDTFSLGLVGVTLPFNKKDFVHYGNVELTLKKVLDTISADQTLLLTHLERNQDREVASRFPSVPLIMGGHDHYHFMDTVGSVLVAKADANLRTVWKHNLRYDFESKGLKVNSELIKLNSSIPESKSVLEVVNRWLEFAKERAGSSGFQLDKVVWQGDSVWECRETVIRAQQTNFGHAVANAMKEFTEAEVALLNSGSLRYDDQLTGIITEGDILKALPFGGSVSYTKIKGDDLSNIVWIGLDTNKGTGGYLQIPGATIENGRVLLNGEPIDTGKMYSVCTSRFMASGKESNLEVLKNFSWEIPNREQGSSNDIRHMTIKYLENVN
ncbi:MAG: hypothetical protein CL840_07090 [Crocinitomicaceae bacterium]|nr:hypothetical protein [Crocinitomicaceae bacterium]